MKYKNITKHSTPQVYRDNLWLAVSDMYVDMITQTDFSTTEAKKIITRDVKFIIREMDLNLK